MALRNRSLILYNLEVTELNRSLDFRAVALGSVLQATLRLGFYSLSGLMTEIKRAMQAADTNNTYTVTADRTVNGGTENRITISTSGSYLDLLFATGPRAASSCAALIGFSGDQTGATTYTGTASAGTVLIPELVGYSFLDPFMWRKNFGVTSVTANGDKESITYKIQKFIQIQFKYEQEANVISDWVPVVDWMIQQKPFDFTPDYVLAPSTVYDVTLESTGTGANGMEWKWKEMLPDFPFLYDTGQLKFRLRGG